MSELSGARRSGALLDELHEMARRIGVSPRAFDGDHYDVAVAHYDKAVAEGAIEVDGTDGLERDLGVGPIEPDAVTLSVYGAQARLAPGQSALVDEVPVEVVSVSGRDVTLRIGGTEVESADDDSDGSSSHRTTKAASTKAAKAAKTTKTRSASAR